MKNNLILAAVAATGMLAASGAHAASLLYDKNVTPNVIFSSSNGAFTVDRENNVELGLRAKLRFDSTGSPTSIYNSDGHGTYSFQAGSAVGGYGWDPSSPATTPVWNFEWSINSSLNGSMYNKLDSLTYLLQIDGDPGAGTNFGGSSGTGGFDPINVIYADHSIGTNSTGNTGGTVAATGDTTGYANLIANNNVAQNSWNYEFFNNTYDGKYLSQLAGFDPNIAGLYTIKLSANNGDAGEVASTSIDILVSAVPLPPTLPLFLSGLFGIGVVARRKRKQRAVAA